jgi:predicted DCC family thiol-disulfide oxidoreductase YuxK
VAAGIPPETLPAAEAAGEKTSISPAAIRANLRLTMPSIPSRDAPDDAPVVLYDGACSLCDSVVTFIVAHERGPTLNFAPLTSAFAAGVVAANPAVAGLDSVLLVEDGRAHARSEAALRIARYLRWPWRGLAALRLLPHFLRDAAYDAVAARRYRWFRRKETCLRPKAVAADRFLS